VVGPGSTDGIDGVGDVSDTPRPRHDEDGALVIADPEPASHLLAAGGPLG